MYRFREVRDEEELTAALALRHEAFAVEKNLCERSDRGLDYDKWDGCSRHFVAIDESGEIVGTVRMVLNSPLHFPSEAWAQFPTGLDRGAAYEVSRVTVARRERRHQPLLLLGLCRAIWKAAHELGLATWCATMERPFIRLLEGVGFRFLHKGDATAFRGTMRVPVLCDMEDTRRALFSPRVEALLAGCREEVEVSTTPTAGLFDNPLVTLQRDGLALRRPAIVAPTAVAA